MSTNSEYPEKPETTAPAPNGSKEPALRLKKPIIKGKKGRGKKKLILIILIILIIAVAALLYLKKQRDAAATASSTSSVTTSVVMRGTIQNQLTSSGTLSPKDTYTITSLVSGEVIEADFEEGDHVEADQVLYVIDSSDAASSVDQAERNLETAQTSYDSAVISYNEAIENLGGGVIKSAQTGYVENISIEEGDTLQAGSVKIGELYNDSSMYIRLAFLSIDADALSIGQDIIVELTDTGETIPGRVEEKSDLVEAINSGTLVKYVKIIVTNPGGLTTADRGIAYMNGIYSISDAYFEPYINTSLRVELPSSVKVSSVLVKEGQYVSSGTALFSITDDSYRDAVTSAENSLKNAENTLTNAEENLENVNDQLDNYTLTSPISGQVITKNYKVGDKVNSSSSNSATLALIYDLSELTFEMNIDELDILNVEVGQEVVVTADAFENETFSGHVTNVSLSSTYSGGVTTYPVVVTLDDSGNLLPGMNIDGVLILEESEDTLYVPSGALIRGNIVYVEDSSLGEGGASGESGEGAEGRKAAPDDGEEGFSGGEGGFQEEGDETSARSSLGDAPAGFTAVEVTTGLISDDYVEILSGLSEGQVVYVRDTTSTTTMFGGMGMGGGMPGGGGGGMPGGGGRR